MDNRQNIQRERKERVFETKSGRERSEKRERKEEMQTGMFLWALRKELG